MSCNLAEQKRKVVDELFFMVDSYVSKTIPHSINGIMLAVNVESKPCDTLVGEFEVQVIVSAVNVNFYGNKVGAAFTAYVSADKDQSESLRYRQPEIERTIDSLLVQITKNLINEMSGK